MRNALRGTLIAGLAAFLVASAAHAQQFRSWAVCGGNAFNTCAAVEVSIDAANNVTVRVFNLAGLTADPQAIFTAIGFENVGTAEAVLGSLTMSGPVRPGDTPSPWDLSNDKQVGGGVILDLVGSTGGIDDGIANACATNLPNGSQDFWQNPCVSDFPASAAAGWITIEFDITGEWDLANTYLLVKAQNGGPDGNLSTECITGGANQNCSVVPEPLTMTLLGTGLAGLGGAGFIRRRRKGNQIVDG